MTTFRVARSAWQPRADLYRAPRGWIIKLDLAGVPAADVEVSLQARHVIISGVRRDRTVTQGHVPYQMEITYSRFERWLELPEQTQSPSVSIVEDAGMLLIHVLEEENCHD